MFAQLMSEMLTPSTFESFRVYSLDTTARLAEALQLVDDIRRQRVPRAVLEPVIEEMRWSFGKDPAARSLAGDEIESLLTLVKNSSFSLDDFTSHLRLIEKLISGKYKETIEQLLLQLFDQPDKRMDFRKLVGFYCSHILNLGYERAHVRNVIEDTFFNRVVSRMGRKSLEALLRKFDGRQRKYIVHTGVTRDLGNYLRGLGFHVSARTAGSAYQTSLNRNSNSVLLPSVLELSIDRLDPEAALNSSYQLLSAQRAISYLDPYGMHCEWGETMHVTLHRAQSGIAVTKSDFLEDKQRTNTSSIRGKKSLRARTISNYAQDIIGNFEPSSTERLLSSIRTAALARTSFSPENRLISLWSAIEVLLSEPQDEARIVHYARLIVPCIVMRHTRRQVYAVHQDLLLRYRSRLNKIIKTMDTASLGHQAFAELIFLQENEQQQMDLCKILEDNPLALHRVFKLQRDYKTIKAVQRTIDDHFDRVQWQIHRVYRARNQLVHAGRMPSYLESVILNLAEYYRSAIVTIVGRAKREADRSSIDQIVSEIGIKYEILRGQFRAPKQDAPMTKLHVQKLMDQQ